MHDTRHKKECVSGGQARIDRWRLVPTLPLDGLEIKGHCVRVAPDAQNATLVILSMEKTIVARVISELVISDFSRLKFFVKLTSGSS